MGVAVDTIGARDSLRIQGLPSLAQPTNRETLKMSPNDFYAGASLAFVTAFGDFVTSIMLYTYNTRPISLEILSSLRQSDVGVAAAYGVVLMAISAAVFTLGADRGGTG